jgi:hypothetical protein
MDPDACFYSFIGAVVDNDLQGAVEALEDLLSWQKRGGSPAHFPRQDDGTPTPIPAQFLRGMYDMLKVDVWDD